MACSSYLPANRLPPPRAQVSLRWVVQQGIPVLPKTDREDWMKENADLFNWELTAAEMAKLTAATKPQTGPTSGDCDVL